MNDTGISWTKFTWNPMSGCVKISEGCKYCYALAIAEAKRGTPAFPNGFDLTIREHKLKEPSRLKEPSLIFVNSMSDIFWDKVPPEYRERIIDVIRQHPQHIFQVLTKRPEAMRDYSLSHDIPDNFWAGTSIESARTMTRLDILRQTRAKVKFISAEPLLSPLTEPGVLTPGDTLDFSGIDWIITGGESGLHLNKPDICKKRGLAMKVFKKWVPVPEKKQWVRDIRDACLRSGATFYHKQWGGIRPDSAGDILDGKQWHQYPEYALPESLRPDNQTVTAPRPKSEPGVLTPRKTGQQQLALI